MNNNDQTCNITITICKNCKNLIDSLDKASVIPILLEVKICNDCKKLVCSNIIYSHKCTNNISRELKVSYDKEV